MATKPKARIPQELKMAAAIPVATQKVEIDEVQKVSPELEAAIDVAAGVKPAPRGKVTMGANGETITDF